MYILDELMILVVEIWLVETLYFSFIYEKREYAQSVNCKTILHCQPITNFYSIKDKIIIEMITFYIFKVLNAQIRR
jgi:hypothetical protein